MAEQVRQVTMKELKKIEQVQQVTKKDLEKVKHGKRLAEWNCKNKEKLAQEAKAQRESENSLTYYGAGAVVAIGVLDVIGYHIYQYNSKDQPKEALVHQPKENYSQ